MTPRPLNIGRLVWIIAIALQITWYILLWSTFISSSEVKKADFISFYTAGVIARSKQAANIYDLQLQHDLQKTIMGNQIGEEEFLPFLHPPIFLPLQTLMAVDDYIAAYKYWTLELLLFLIFDAVLIWFWLRGQGLKRYGVFLFLISAILFYPLFISLLKGQDTIFLLLGVLLCIYGYYSEKYWLVGLGLSITLIRPQVALILAIPYITKNRKILGWSILWAALIGAFCFLLLGSEGVRGFINTLFVSAAGQGYGLNQTSMFNLTGLLLRLFPGLNVNTVHMVSWGFFVLALVGVLLVSKLSKLDMDWQISLSVTVSIFAAPHLHFHDLALFLIPLILAGLAGVRSEKLTTNQAAILPLLISLVFLFADLWAPLRTTFPYLLIIGLPILVWQLKENHHLAIGTQP